MTWEPEFFHLAGFMIGCKMRANGGMVEDDSDPRCASVLHGADMIGCQIGELDYGSEMHLVLREAGMLPTQRLARCAGRLLNGRNEARRDAGRDRLGAHLGIGTLPRQDSLTLRSHGARS
jgi:hypothetical protein